MNRIKKWCHVGLIVGCLLLATPQQSEASVVNQVISDFPQLSRQTNEKDSHHQQLDNEPNLSAMQGRTTKAKERVEKSTFSKQGKIASSTEEMLLGKQNLLVILVEYEDEKIAYSEEDWYKRLFDSKELSLATYYDKETRGIVKVIPASESYGETNNGIVKVSLPKKHPNLGGGGSGSLPDELMAAIKKAANYIDFNSYDKNNDKRITADELHIMTIFSGYESADSSKTPSMYAHRGGGIQSDETVDGLRFSTYTLFGEKHESNQATVGVIAHEFGHDIGFPDLYNVGYQDENGNSELEGSGIGTTSLMGTGGWAAKKGNPPGANPMGLDPYCKELLGMPVEVVGSTVENKQLKATETTFPTLLRINTTNPNEYFLIENRQPVGNDSTMDGLFSGGIMIVRVDKTYKSNHTWGKQVVTVIEADEGIRGYSFYQSNGIYNADPFYYVGTGIHKESQQNVLSKATTPSTSISTGEKQPFKIQVNSTSQDIMSINIDIEDDSEEPSEPIGPLSKQVKIKFIEDTKPLLPVHPDDPNQDVEPNLPGKFPNDNYGNLMITYASDFNFGTRKKGELEMFATADSILVNDQEEKVTPFVSIQDFRGTDRQGWALLVRQETPFVNTDKHSLLGAELSLTNLYFAEKEKAPIASEKESILSTDQISVATADSLSGYGRWSLGLGELIENQLTNGVKLSVPKGTVIDTATYKSVVEWELVEDPTLTFN